MCGITGFIGKGKKEDLKKMTTLLSHRGPDGEGLWNDVKKGVYLGHRRLSIVDIAGGTQPMWTDDESLGIVYNGEIYNHMELREDLTSLGYTFHTDHSDTEALLIAWKHWGKETPEKLNGMWAFAVYNKKTNKLFLSRDRFGQKPLYYSLQNGTFAFSSELKSLITHPSIHANISERSLKKYFAYGYVPAPNSIFEKIYKLPAGYNMIIDGTYLNYHIWKYWDFVIEPFDNIPENPEDVWGEEIRNLLSNAVRRRLMSDVPLGVFLSGGIDSSSIASVAASIAGSEKVKTFCTGFFEDSFNESMHAQYAASYLSTKHYDENLSLDKAIAILPTLIERLDEPMGDSSLLPTYLLCRNTRKHVTVALGGDGADELFAGYNPFHALKISEMYNDIVPKPVHKAIRMITSRFPVSYKNMSLDFKIKRALMGIGYKKAIWNPVWLGPIEPSEFNELFNTATDVEDIYSEAIEQWENCTQNNLLDKTLQFYTKIYLQDSILTKIDRAGMLHSLEVRSPYLDIDLINFVRRIPAIYKYRKGNTKYILKKALKDVLPNKIIHRKKHGFGMPIGKWFQEGNLKLNLRETKDKLNISFLRKKENRHIKKKHDHRLFLYNVYVLENYMNSIAMQVENEKTEFGMWRV